MFLRPLVQRIGLAGSDQSKLKLFLEGLSAGWHIPDWAKSSERRLRTDAMVSALHDNLGIAVVDDDAVFREVTCAMLSSRSGIVPFPVASGDELFSVLSQQRIDCIVLDYDLGGDTGLSVITKLDQQFPEPPPVIMLTGDGRESTAIKAFRMGVSDYLPKRNLQPKGLISTIARVVGSERERLQKSAEVKRLMDGAAIDLVSGLFGRVHLDARLRQLQAMPLESRRFYAVIVCEMVDFQSIMRSVGIKAGDGAIRAFGKQLKTLTRSEDICGRYEDGTFLVIANVNADPALLQTLCQRFATNLSIAIELSSAKLALRASVAGALCDGASVGELDPASLLGPAFERLSEAKAEGRVDRLGLPCAEPSVSEPAHVPAEPASDRPQVLPAAEQLRTGDRRSDLRQRVFKRGVVHMHGSHSTFNCTVRNLSARGAGLRLDTPFAVPATFDFEIIGHSGRRRAVVQWQAGTDVGISFIQP